MTISTYGSCHKIMLMRSRGVHIFKQCYCTKLWSQPQLSSHLHEIRHLVFMKILEYLYTDDVYISVGMAFDILAAESVV